MDTEGRSAKLKQFREQAVATLEELLADKLEEVALIQEQLALLSKHHVVEMPIRAVDDE